MIQMNCPGCGAKLKVPDDAVGKTKPCPKCGTPVTVEEPVYDAEAIPEPDGPADLYGLDEPGPEKSGEADEARRPCPMCGEMIVASAAKCRFCGEIFDPALRRAQALTTRAPADENLTSGEWVVAVLCSGIGCIMGIIWMIQGKPKGKKMFGVSLLFGILWSIVRAAIESANNK